VFELGTCRLGARSYVFAAETSDDRQQWMTVLAKVQTLRVGKQVSKFEHEQRCRLVFVADTHRKDIIFNLHLNVLLTQ